MMKRFTISILLLLTLVPALSAHAQLVLSAKSTGLVTPQKASTVEFRVGELSPATDELAYVISDYTGTKVGEGKAAYTGKRADAGITTTLTLPAGYYEITFPALKQTFGVICLNMPKGRKDPFFCLDAGLSWLVREQSDRQRLILLMQQLGIDIARERLGWGDVNGGVGKFNWDGGRNYGDLRKRYELIGLGVLEVFHDTPKHLGPTEQNPYPADLVAASQAWAAIGNHWKDVHAGLEVWNEPDGRFGGNLPADQYVPLVKAVSRGLSSAKIRTPIGGGALARMDDAFLRGLAGSGMMRAVDFVSVHNYEDGGESVRKQVTKLRHWLEASGAPGAGIWITESGKSWPTKSGDRAEPADDAAVALSIVAKAVEARACGVERYFLSVLPFDNITGGDAKTRQTFSMTGQDGTPLRSLAAYAACIATLSNRAYVGDLKIHEKGFDQKSTVSIPPIFTDDATAVVVLYDDKAKPGKDKPGARTFAWHSGLPIIKILGIDGRELKLVDGGKTKRVPLDDGLAYVFISIKDLDKFQALITNRMELTRQARQPRERLPLPPVVLQHLPDFASVTATSGGYKITKGDAKQWPLAIRVNNFSHGEELTLTVRAFPGTAASGGGNKTTPSATPSAQPTTRPTTATTTQKPLAAQTITLEPGKNGDVTLTVDLIQANNEVLITIGDDTNELDRLLLQFR